MKRLCLVLEALACAAPIQAASPLADLGAGKQPRLKTIYPTIKTLDYFVTSKTVVVGLVFLGTECPVARQYLPRLKELHAQYKPRGVQFLGIYSDAGGNGFRMAPHAHAVEIPCPV